MKLSHSSGLPGHPVHFHRTGRSVPIPPRGRAPEGVSEPGLLMVASVVRRPSSPRAVPLEPFLEYSVWTAWTRPPSCRDTPPSARKRLSPIAAVKPSPPWPGCPLPACRREELDQKRRTCTFCCLHRPFSKEIFAFRYCTLFPGGKNPPVILQSVILCPVSTMEPSGAFEWRRAS